MCLSAMKVYHRALQGTSVAGLMYARTPKTGVRIITHAVASCHRHPLKPHYGRSSSPLFCHRHLVEQRGVGDTLLLHINYFGSNFLSVLWGFYQLERK